MKWRTLLKLPSYEMQKQTHIIIACMPLHNFICDSALTDELFERCDEDEEYIPSVGETSSSETSTPG
uniref:DDE Tnp4 domain-containing protein n=1 Tax=Arundo donax TaxID=35708 RepID=A0A0A8XRG8_ARUDO